MAVDIDRIGDKLKSAIVLNSRFSAALLDLSTSYLKSLGAILTASGEPGEARADAPPQAVPPLLLAAPAGEEARASILVENSLAHSVSAQVVPLGEAIASTVVVTPATAHLEPGEQLTLQISVRIDAGLDVNNDYPGELAIPELSSRTIPFVVRRLPDKAPADHARATTATPRKRTTSKRKTRAKTKAEASPDRRPTG